MMMVMAFQIQKMMTILAIMNFKGTSCHLFVDVGFLRHLSKIKCRERNNMEIEFGLNYFLDFFCVLKKYI